MQRDFESYVSSRVESPPAAGIWVFIAGVIPGDGESHYHWHPDYVCLHILSRGKGTVCTPSETHHLEAGDMFTLWPGVEIEYFKDPDDPWFVHYIHLLGEHAVTYARECGFDKNKCFIQPDNPIGIIHNFKTVCDILKAGDQSDLYQVQALLYDMIKYFRKKPASRPQQVDNKFESLVDRAKMLIEAELDSGLNVNDLCAMLRIGRTTLFKAFNSILNVSPIEYLTSVRLSRAKTLLAERCHSVSKISQMTGYKSPGYFRKCFKKHENMSITEWINKTLSK